MTQYTQMRKRKPGPGGRKEVYAELDELMRLRFKATGFSFLPRQPIHSILSGRHASKLRGRGLNFEELRNYLPGDDPRNIDWKVTARTREPHVRVYTEEKDRTVWLLVDQRVSMFFGSRWKMKSVVAAEAAAAAAWRVLSQGDRVGALIFDDSDLQIVPPHRSEENVVRVLQQIIRKNHALNAKSAVQAGPEMLNRALQRVAAVARHDCLICLIGDGNGIDDDTRKYVTRLTEHNDVLSVFIYDPLEQSMPAAGRLVFSDGFSQLEFNTGEKALRAAYGDDFQQRLERMRATSRRHAIPLLPVHTAAPVLEQVREQLGNHRK
jgi:uncharacterized protein (DUF58 family)